MNDKSKVVDLYNKFVPIYNSINSINNNINRLIDCLNSNFTINGKIVESDAIYSAQSKLLSVRDNINSEIFEYLKQYF